ncbi:MAG TPA: argininosuccinate lyase [Nitrospiria bacterium]
MKKKESPKKMWGGRFSGKTHARVEAFTASIPFDRRLYAQDIEGSLAWARALEHAKVLSRTEARKIGTGLRDVRKAIEAGRAEFSVKDEDIHTAVERLLTERIGDLAGKLHTGRSRNDQVALDLRLFLREQTDAVIGNIRELSAALAGQAGKHLDTVIPGYTHLQRAQPVRLAHHLLAYLEMLDRDQSRFLDIRRRLNVLPLGSGALAGTNYPIDRAALARVLGFDSVTENSMDAVSDRDGAIEWISAASILMMHLSRFCEELILWGSEEFGFADLPEAFCTGSSLMPQKLNPDVPELIRGKTGRVYGNLIGLLTVMKALPLAYNKDLQEDKEAVFDTVDTARDSLEVLAAMVPGIRFRRDRMKTAARDSLLLATEVADYLVGKGLPFRKAHEVTGGIVRYCLEKKRDLAGLSLAEFQRFSNRFQNDIKKFLRAEAALERKKTKGATAKSRVVKRLRAFEKSLGKKRKT